MLRCPKLAVRAKNLNLPRIRRPRRKPPPSCVMKRAKPPKIRGRIPENAEPSADTAEEARSQFEEYLRAVRAEGSKEESPVTSDVDDTDRNSAAEGTSLRSRFVRRAPAPP